MNRRVLGNAAGATALLSAAPPIDRRSRSERSVPGRLRSDEAALRQV